MIDHTPPGYTVREAERLLGLPRKRGYALIKDGHLRAVRDVTGALRIPYPELHAYDARRGKGIAEKEGKRETIHAMEGTP